MGLVLRRRYRNFQASKQWLSLKIGYGSRPAMAKTWQSLLSLIDTIFDTILRVSSFKWFEVALNAMKTYDWYEKRWLKLKVAKPWPALDCHRLGWLGGGLASSGRQSLIECSSNALVVTETVIKYNKCREYAVNVKWQPMFGERSSVAHRWLIGRTAQPHK